MTFIIDFYLFVQSLRTILLKIYFQLCYFRPVEGKRWTKAWIEAWIQTNDGIRLVTKPIEN